MLKTSLTLLSLLSATLLMSGCGSNNGEKQLEIQNNLDNGNFNAVINSLQESATSESDYLSLSAAYAGRAGLTLSDMIVIFSDSGESRNAFGAFVIEVNEATQDTQSPMQDLTKSIDYYNKVVSKEECEDATALTSSQKDICIYKGLTETVNTAVVLDALSDNVDAVFSVDSEGRDIKLTASTCAMHYTKDPRSVTECMLLSKNSVTFADGISYDEIVLNVNDDTTKTPYHYLITKDTKTSVVITQGYCSLNDFSTRSQTLESSYHICPLREDANTTEITTSSSLADALNDATISINTADNEDIKSDIESLKKDIFFISKKSTDEDITDEDIIFYLDAINR